MTKKRNMKYPSTSLDERLMQAANEAKAKAERLKPGAERDELLNKARQFESQTRINKFFKAG